MYKSLTKEQMDYLYHKNIDLRNRIITFMPWQPEGELDEEQAGDWSVNDYTAQNLIKGLHILNCTKNAPIKIIWLSYGGCWNAGMAIYDYIRKIKSPVTIEAYGRIRSMGTIILQACSQRLLSSNCEFLIHYGTGIGEGDSAHTKDIINSAEEAKRCNKTMEDIYLRKIREKHPRYKRERLQELIKYDKYLTPKGTIDLGLADGIIK